MKNNVTEIVFILDKSGSMHSLVNDTIGGFNSMLNKQKEEAGEAYVTTVLFSDSSTTIHDRLPISKVPEMTTKDYWASGCTALIDSLGETIDHISKIHKYARPEDVPANTIFIITTDGMENASHKYSAKDVKKTIEKKQKEDGWEFIFLGANIDAVQTADNLGIRPEMAVQYHADVVGTAVNYECMSEAVSCVRTKGKLGSSWRKKADADYAKRG